MYAFLHSGQRRPGWIRSLTLAAMISALLSLYVLQAEAGAGLVITPHFGATITADTANSAAIEDTINSAISLYEDRFANPITVKIDFEEMTSGLGQSDTGFYSTSYADYRTALIADKALGGDDPAFLSNLPMAGNPVPGQSISDVLGSSAQLRALSFSGADPLVTLDGVNYDSQISLNTGLTNITRSGTPDPFKYDLKAVTSHEIDEALGINSTLNTGFPAGYVGSLDFFRYNGPNSRSFTTSTSEAAYFSIDGGTTPIVYFNQQGSGDRSDWASAGEFHQGPARVQDAFGSPGSAPNLSSAELTALDVVGYNTAAAAPEPSQWAGLGTFAFGVFSMIRKARKKTAACRA